MFISATAADMTEDNLKCIHCEKLFCSKKSLRAHTNVHLGTYQCLFCIKSFDGARNLYTHYRSHIKEKPYFCNSCENLFGNLGSLTRYTKSHKAEKFFRATFAKSHFLEMTIWKAINCCIVGSSNFLAINVTNFFTGS